MTRKDNAGQAKIALVGIGNVGAAFAFALSLKRLAGELVLVDANAAKAEGEAMDIMHGLPLTGPMDIRAGGYDQCAGADIVVISAGVNQKPGQSRLDLLKANADIMGGVAEQVMTHAPGAIFLVATNPVDVLTLKVLKQTGLPPARVIGSGTVLDSSRLRSLLSDYLAVDVRGIHAHIIGEHGDSELAVWSRANVSGIPLAEFCEIRSKPYDEDFRRTTLEKVRRAAYEIISRKGATAYGVSVALCRIVEAILKDEKSVLTVSTPVQGLHGLPDVCLSLPCVVGAGGVELVLESMLSEEEHEALANSATVLRENARALGVI